MSGDERNQANAQESEEDKFAAFLAQSEQDEQEQQAEPEGEEAPPEAQTSAPPQQEAPKPDAWLEEIPETVRERVRQELAQREATAKQLESQWKAQAGQVKPTQQALEQARRENEELRRKLQQPPTVKPEGMSQGAWDRHKRNFEEESAAIEERLNPIEQRLKSQDEQIAGMSEYVNRVRLKEAQDRDAEYVASIHPDFPEIEKSEPFEGWLVGVIHGDESGPPDPVISEMFARQGGKFTAEQGAWLVTQYKRDLGWFNAQQVAPQQPAASPKAQAALARRDQQKRDPAVGIKTGQSATTSRANATGGYPGEDEFAAFLAANPP